MKNKQMLFSTVPFVICIVLIGIVSLLDLIDVRITAILMFICLGCQQLFIGLKFHKEDKSSRTEHILAGIGMFVFVLMFVLIMVLKAHGRIEYILAGIGFSVNIFIFLMVLKPHQ